MAKHDENVTMNGTDVAVETDVAVDTVANEYPDGTELCEIVKEGDNYYLVDLIDGTKSEALKVYKDGNSLVLPVNKANRKWSTISAVEKTLAKGERFTMTYRATRTIGPVGERLPNEKLISYLPEDVQAEYKDIIARAKKARDDAKSKPMTPLEKAQAKLAKAQEALKKAMEEADALGVEVDEVVAD